MSLAPEAAMSPLADAPPDRPAVDAEQSANQFLAIIMRDGGIDENEMRILRGVMEQITLKIQQQGGLAASDVRQAQSADPGASPMEQNATGMQDYGDGQGEPTGEIY